MFDVRGKIFFKRMKKNIIWIDYARTIGIWLVILGHSIQKMPGWKDSFLHTSWDWIYLFHMPLFFIISGYLYKQKQSETLITGGGKIWRSLVAPYLVYQMAYLPFAIWFHRKELLAEGQWWKLLVGILDGDGYNTPISLYVCLPCWFIVSIIWLRLLFLYVNINKFSTAMMIMLSVLFLVIRKHQGFDLFFCLDSTIMAIPYFLIGYYMKTKSILERMKGRTKLLSVAILSAIIVSLMLMFNGPAQMNRPSYGLSIISCYIAGFSGSMLVFSISKLMAHKFGEKPEIKLISRNTLFIIFAHWVVLFPFGMVVARVLNNNSNIVVPMMCSLVLSACVLLISKKWIEMWIDKYPIVFGKSKV